LGRENEKNQREGGETRERGALASQRVQRRGEGRKREFRKTVRTFPKTSERKKGGWGGMLWPVSPVRGGGLERGKVDWISRGKGASTGGDQPDGAARAKERAKNLKKGIEKMEGKPGIDRDDNTEREGGAKDQRGQARPVRWEISEC